jgi:cell division initiation protein
MITPIEIQSKSFKTGIGYDKKDVDGFLHEILIGYETLYKENMELNDKLNTLNEGISYYKTIEKTLQKALVLAEKTAEETKEAARKQAKAIEDEARGKAQLIIADASNELERLNQQTIQLIRQYEAYKAQFKHLAAAQCELLESDSFQIHIANLETFVHNQNDPASNDKKSGTGEEIEYTKITEPSDKDEGFEFYNINEDEQE